MARNRRDPLLILGIAGGATAILAPLPLVLVHESSAHSDLTIECRGLAFRTATARALRLSNLVGLQAVRVLDPGDVTTDLACGHLRDYSHLRFARKPTGPPLDVQLSDLDLLPGDRIELRGAREELSITQERAGATTVGESAWAFCAPRAPAGTPWPVEKARASNAVECAFNLGADPASVEILSDPAAPCSLASRTSTGVELRGAQCRLQVVGAPASDAVSLLDGPIDFDCVDFGETKGEHLAGVASYFRVSDVRAATVSYADPAVRTALAVGPDVALELEPSNGSDAARIVSLAVGPEDSARAHHRLARRPADPSAVDDEPAGARDADGRLHAYALRAGGRLQDRALLVGGRERPDDDSLRSVQHDSAKARLRPCAFVS